MASKERKKRETTEKALRPIRPSAAITDEYNRKLMRLIREMQDSVVYWLKASYRQNEDRIVAYDESPSEMLRRTMKELADRWLKKFDVAAERLAEWFSQSVEKRSTDQMKKILRDGGISVQFEMTPAMRDTLEATVNANVSLIKSIPQKYFTEVEGLVQRSVQTGRDMGYLSNELQKRYGITRRRADLIARTQNEMATAAFNKVRMLEAGITEAVWLHSHAGKAPRPTHVKAGREREKFDVAKGWFDPDPKVRRHIQPGELINCFPAETVLKFAQDVKVAFRAWYSGELSQLVMEGDETLTATPNHPVLTPNGWIAIGSLKEGDYVIKVSDHGIKPIVDETDRHKSMSSIIDAFDTIRCEGNADVTLGADFHGDIVEGNVDVVFANNPLSFGLKPSIGESFDKLPLAMSDVSAFGVGFRDKLFVASGSTSDRIMCGFGQFSATIGTDAIHSDCIGFAGTSALDAVLSQYSPDDSPLAATSNVDSNGKLTVSRKITGDDGVLVKVVDGVGGLPALSAIRDGDASILKVPSDSIGPKANDGGYFGQSHTLKYELVRVVDNTRRDFSGHVYTLETECGWFAVSNAAIITKNCRCTSRPVIKGFS